MDSSQTNNFCLKWNEFSKNVSKTFKELRSENDLFDVTLACIDSKPRTLQAHKLVLSACSNFFKSIFRLKTKASKHPNPLIFLHGVTYDNLILILDFIYNGEVNVQQEDLNSFMTVAEELQIKGLTNHGKKDFDNTKSSSISNPSKKFKYTQWESETLK